MQPTVSTVLRVIALVCFVFAAFNFNPFPHVLMLPIGLAFWVASRLP